MLNELVTDGLFSICGSSAKTWHSVDDVAHQVEAIEIIHHTHIEWGAGGTFLLVTADMQISVASSPIGQSMNEPWIAVEREDDGLIRRE